MIDFTKGPALGYVFVGHQRRPFYSCREIRRGKNKGKLEVEYRLSATKYRKLVTTEDQLRRFTGDDEKFTHDNPCPKCGKWLFHSIYGCH